MKEAVITVTCPLGRYTAGEVGKILDNDFEKYDYKLEFSGVTVGRDIPPYLKKGDVIKRIYYFYEAEVEQV